MSTKRKTKTSPQTGGDLPDSGQPSDAIVEGPEPSVDGPDIDGPDIDGPDIDGPDIDGPDINIPEFTFRQHSALPAIAVARSVAQAARDTGVAERTLRRWLSDPEFRKELNRVRQESYDLARQQLQAILPRAVSVITEIAEDSPDPVLRLRAARYLMTYSNRIHEVEKLQSRLSDLDEAVEHIRGTNPVD